jgi:hypothetical protein
MDLKIQSKNLGMVLMVVSVLALAPFASVAWATPNEKVKIMWDDAPESPAVDSEGPTGYGFVNYSQNSTMLRTVVALKNAEVNTTYTVYLVCGPTHALGCGFITIGYLTTDEDGNGNTGAIWTMLTDITGPAGEGTYHIDLINDNTYLTEPMTITK